MKKTVVYRYLGENGVLEAPILLPNTYYVKIFVLEADQNKILTNGTTKTIRIRVPESEVNDWYEIPFGQE